MLNIILFISHLLINIINDYIAQIINLQPIQIVFFRFLFASLLLLPFIKKNIVTNNIYIHIIRGILLLSGLLCWIYGLQKTHLTSATAIGFMTPIFIVILESIFIQKTKLYHVTTINIGFIGVILAIYDDAYIISSTLIIFLVATLCFSILDILTKKISHECIFNSSFLIYISITFLLIPYILFYNYYYISLYNIMICILLGLNSNLIIYCIVYAYRSHNPSYYGSYRYLEIIFSFIIQYIFINKLPSNINYIGIIIIILTVYLHNRNNK